MTTALAEAPLTPYQMRQARRLLFWSRTKLAAQLGVSESPVARFEDGGPCSSVLDLQKAHEILKAAGVVFAEDGSEDVRLARGGRHETDGLTST